MKHKYGIKPSDPTYHNVVAKFQYRRRVYNEQLERWNKIVEFVYECETKGMTYPEIAEEITKTTEYKLLERSKEMNYEQK